MDDSGENVRRQSIERNRVHSCYETPRGGGNLNIRAAMLHVIGDIGASAGVIVSGAIIDMH